MKRPANPRRSILLGLAVLAGLIVYAYGFEVTKVSLEEMGQPERQASLVRILRAISHPPIVEYEQSETLTEAPFYVPCPAVVPQAPAPAATGPSITVDPTCADPGAEVAIEGFGFRPRDTGPINFIPPSGVNIQLGNAQMDAEGHFRIVVQVPERPEDVAQLIRVVTRRNVGSPHLTQTAIDTWDKIIETVFLALLATTLGTALAVPASFLAARNLMKDIHATVASVALWVLAIPAGAWIGAMVARSIVTLGTRLSAPHSLALASTVIGLGAALGLFRWAMPPEETRTTPPPWLRAARLVTLLVAGVAFLIGLHLLAGLAEAFGLEAQAHLGGLGFLGGFVSAVGAILGALVTPFGALVGAGVLASAVGRLGRMLDTRLSPGLAKGVNLVLAGLAGATLGTLIAFTLHWFYEFNSPLTVAGAFAVVLGIGGLALAARSRAEAPVPIGLAVYYVTRTVFNALRAIEPLIMVIVFAVWVGAGPFAGVLALALHTVAALAKLYSEQVESILPGPLEAIMATGANRLQTIVYAVIPQIVPPYISFTMYRWDINVRMSTIIGFAGGGGIGFLLQQNINLLNYRGASAQMLAIAIVVASMDYLSSTLREKVV
jgi:phosphonate ABC transporter permease subunit PhnE